MMRHFSQISILLPFVKKRKKKKKAKQKQRKKEKEKAENDYSSQAIGVLRSWISESH